MLVTAMRCYSCGYMRKNMSSEMAELPDTPFCNDFAKPTDLTVECSDPGDCCVSMREEYVMYESYKKAWLSKKLCFSSLLEGKLPSNKDENHI